MKTLRYISTLAVAGAMLFASPAMANADAGASVAPLPAVPALSNTDEYKSVVETVSSLEALAKEKDCRKGKGGKTVCRTKTLTEDEHKEAESSLDDDLDTLDDLVSTREDDRSAAIDDWVEAREPFLHEPLEARHESQSEYLNAWLDGGMYTCYADGGFNNCFGAGSGSELTIETGQLDAIENKYNNVSSDRTQLRAGLHASCNANKTYGTAAIKKAKTKLDKAKAKSKAKENAQKAYDKLKTSLAKCHTKADSADIANLDDDEFASAIQDSIVAEQENVIEQKDDLDESNDKWYDKAEAAADKSIDQGEAAATRTADKAQKADSKSYDKLAARAAAALDKVEPS